MVYDIRTANLKNVGIKPKSASHKKETLEINELKEFILDWAACLKSASPLPRHPQLP
jgi:hypothetical protein